MVKNRRDPNKGSNTGVESALEAVAAGDDGAVEGILLRKGETPVPEDWQSKYKARAQDFWDHFYVEKTVNFFKDRHYLREEFGELMPEEIASDPKKWVPTLDASGDPPSTPRSLSKAMEGRMVLLEVGCAVGNGVLPLLRANTNMFAFACDLSPVAVELLQGKEEYRCGRCVAFACDVTRGVEDQPSAQHEPMELRVPSECVDFATILFVLSAISPERHVGVLQRLYGRLRPGGVVMVRDYGRGDFAQLRFKPGHWLGGDLYVRGDGTLALFLTAEGLAADFRSAGFEILQCEYRRTEVVNRGTGVRMPRVWVQGRFRRPTL